MKRLTFLPLLLASAASGQPPAPANVYILPMGGGLDQYLAGQLTRSRILPVVADPKAAGIILTDRIGEAFEAKLAQLIPPAPSDDDKDGDEKKDAPFHPAFRSSARTGTYFLVDAKTRQVVWSGYCRPVANPTPDRLNRQAAQIAKSLKTGLGK